MHQRTFLRLLLLVARREYLRTVRRRGFVFGTALLPLVMGGSIALSQLLSQPGSGRPETLTIHLADESALQPAPDPVNGPHVQLVDRAEGERLLAGGRIKELYVLGDDYLATGRIERIVAPSRSLDVESLERRRSQQLELGPFLRAALLRGQSLPADTAQRLIAPVEVSDVEPSGAGAAGEPGIGSFFFPYAFSLLFVLSIFITSGYLLQSVTEEKENRVVEIILSSVPALPLMGGKILGLGAAGLTQVLIWVSTALVGLPLLGERIGSLSALSLSPVTVILAIVYFVLGYLGYGAIFSAIGAIAPGTREAQQYSGFLGFFAVIPLAFTGLFLSDPSSPIVTALALIPLTAPASVLQLISLTPEPPWLLVTLSLLILAGFSGLATLFSARVFRATLLLYGMRPGVRQIWRAMVAGA